MIELNTERLAGIQVLHAAPAGQREAALPTVLLYHGFTSSKEVYAYLAVALAQAGFRAVMPDADLHGARDNGNDAVRLSRFWQILQRNIDELPQLENALRAAGLVDGDRFAVAGASLGGMTALGAMARYPQIRSVACLMGSAYFMRLSHSLFPPVSVSSPDDRAQFDRLMAPLAAYDPSEKLEALANRPLLLWHGEADDVVPFAETARLAEALQGRGQAEKMTFFAEKGISHKITPFALRALVDFFKRNL
ncbi:MAG: esterase [Pantoea sp.]|uniref:esterase n=1 Tax=Pantoea septica TaxID=472695 RepID=UPI001C0FBBC4|nr:esterase [Pantoea septica]MBU5376539.1 esterase [Pantoea septica]MDU6441013.1 esterase [Pantoea sp.]